MNDELQIKVLDRIVERLDEAARAKLDEILAYDDEKMASDFLQEKGIDLAQIAAEERAKLDTI